MYPVREVGSKVGYAQRPCVTAPRALALVDKGAARNYKDNENENDQEGRPGGIVGHFKEPIISPQIFAPDTTARLKLDARTLGGPSTEVAHGAPGVVGLGLEARLCGAPDHPAGPPLPDFIKPGWP